jgi:hypothetical protein
MDLNGRGTKQSRLNLVAYYANVRLNKLWATVKSLQAEIRIRDFRIISNIAKQIYTEIQ